MPEHWIVPDFGGSCIYFIQAGDGPIKIGFSSTGMSANQRLDTLQVGNHVELSLRKVIPATHQDEQEMHERFAEHRIRGEWFEPCDELVDLVFGAKADVIDIQSRRHEVNTEDAVNHDLQGNLEGQIHPPRLKEDARDRQDVPAYTSNSADSESHAEARTPSVAGAEKPMSRKQADGRGA